MKKLAVLMLAVALVGCATWDQMTTAQKFDAVAQYYDAFTQGAKVLGVMFPQSALVTAALDALDSAVKALNEKIQAYYAGKATEADVNAQADAAYLATKQVNCAAATAKGEVCQ